MVGYEVSRLSEFATVRRYEEGALEITLEEAQDVLDIARKVLEWAKGEESKLNPK